MRAMVINGTVITQPQLMILRTVLINQICSLSDMIVNPEITKDKGLEVFKLQRARSFEVVQAIDGEDYPYNARTQLKEDYLGEPNITIDGVGMHNSHRRVIRMAITSGQYKCQEIQKQVEAKLATIAIVENKRFLEQLDKLSEIIHSK